MATFTSKDIQLLFIGGDAVATTGAIDAMNDGEIGIFTPAGARVTELTAASVDRFIIVKKTPNGGVPLTSSPIKKKDIKRIFRKEYEAAVDQRQVIGYNGTDGAIEMLNDNEYHVRISMAADYVDNHGGLYMKHGFYASDINATEDEVASNLLATLQANFSKEPEQLITFSMLCDDAGVATAGTVDVVSGSKFINASVPADFAVGGLVRLGTATTDPCYKVVSIVGSVVELGSKVTEASQQFLAGAAMGVTSALASAASFGLVLAGNPTNHRTAKEHNDLMPVRFDVGVENFGATPNVLELASSAGSGTQRQVQEMEWFCQGNEGDFYRIGEPNLITPRTEALGNYDLIDIQIEELYTGSITTGPIHKSYTLAIPETAPNYSIDATADDITDVLEVLVYGAVDGSLATV